MSGENARKGRVAGIALGSVLNPWVGSIVFGAIFVVIGLVSVIGDLSSSRTDSDNVVYVEDTSLWGAVRVKVVEMSGGTSVVEYSYAAGTRRAEMPGSPPENWRVSYNPDNPSEVALMHINKDWVATNARVVETRDDSYTLEYDILEQATGVLPGRPGDSERVGASITVRYEKADPSNIAREVRSSAATGIDVVSVLQIVFGGGFIVFGLWVRSRVVKRKGAAVQNYIKQE